MFAILSLITSKSSELSRTNVNRSERGASFMRAPAVLLLSAVGSSAFTLAFIDGVYDPPEAARSYSSWWSSGANGLQRNLSTLGSTTAWSAGSNSSEGEWVVMDLGEDAVVVGVVTMVRYDAVQLVTRFDVQISTAPPAC